MKKLLILFALLLPLSQSCEIFTIKGNKIVVEDQSAYSQKTPIGVITIFMDELANDNTLAASELLVNADGTLLTAKQKYDISPELSRMKRFLDGKKITNQAIDTTTGVVNVSLELDGKSKARFVTQSINSLFYIVSFDKE
ncbi:MAG: hypothetical protein LBO69_08575 [Ignavibacteria bacterium]|nr:hypothetical protein [Ignavibacteria bacterium]